MTKIKKRKLSVKKISILTLIIFSTALLIGNLANIRNFIFSKISGYNEKTVAVFIEADIYNEIKDYEYSKTLETIINTQHYNKKYLKDYLNINYIENDSFLKNITSLLDKGYIANDINNIYSKLSEESINYLLNNDYFKDINNIISINYFREDNLERYINYYKKETLDAETTITYVNIGLDNEYYTNVIDIQDNTDLLVLVNKYHKLDKNYVPSELEKVSYGSGKLKKEARIAFDSMCLAAEKEDINIYGGSGYRSYNYQLNLYNRYAALDGKTVADTYSARAGYSEHQTGLAMDILNGKRNYIDKEDKEYTWLINNSYKFGFILRYPEGKEKITGYMYEPWHYRYVGVELATELNKLNITYEEYIAKK